MLRILNHSYYRSTLLSAGCISFILGLAFSSFVATTSLGAIIFIAVVAFIRINKANWLTVLLLVVAGFSLGSYRGAFYLEKVNSYKPYYDQKITIVGTALNDAVYGKNGQLSFDVSDIFIDGQHMVGKIGVAGFGENMIYQGDKLEVSGKLRAGMGSYRGWISYGVIDTKKAGGTLIDSWRRQLSASLASVLPEPLGPFGMGLLIGQRNTLPDTTTDNLLHVGLVHIIAVSGYNLTILIKAVRLLLKRGSKYQVAILSFCMIGVFLLFAGNSPSIVRAAIISSMALLAWYYGRSLNPLLMILLAASITAFANPAYVWSDSGWYLSFLAFIGVVIVAPMVLNKLPSGVGQSLIGSMIVETLCAELMTIPYVMYVFGQTSLVALPANMLIASFVPLAMLVTIVAGLAGLLLPALAGWFAWPATQVLNYMLDGCALLNKIPGIFIDNLYIQSLGLLVVYASIIFATIVLSRKMGRKVLQ